MTTSTIARATSCALLLCALPGAALAQPENWAIGLQEPVTEMAQRISGFNTFTMVIVTLVALLVLALLVVVMVRFNARRNPTPSATAHNTLIEVAWTTIPVVILLIIAIPSFRLLYDQYEVPPEDLVIKAIGRQWAWDYEYGTDVMLTSNLLADEAITDPETQPRLLAVDFPIVVPVDAVVLLQVTATDVIHSWAMPAFGVKTDAIPGTLNETWFRVERPGVYYGQCSELCGQGHAYMPIEVWVVTPDQYTAWRAVAAQATAAGDYAPLRAHLDELAPSVGAVDLASNAATG